MEVKIRFFTNLREIVGNREETLTFAQGEPVTINFVLQVLSEKYGSRFTDYLYDSTGRPKNFLQFLVNGISVSTLDGFETILKDGDVLAILPPVGGG